MLTNFLIKSNQSSVQILKSCLLDSFGWHSLPMREQSEQGMEGERWCHGSGYEGLVGITLFLV